MRYKAIVQYDGTNYYGWQKQGAENQIGVSSLIEKAVSKILDTPTIIHGSGRTDRGVHANHQVFHFDSEKKVKNLKRLTYSINSQLPKDIYIVKISRVSDNFHARYSVKDKTYLYAIVSGLYSPFDANHAFQLNSVLDVPLMNRAAKLFIGEHSFKNFTTKEEDEAAFMRTIFSFRVIRNGDYDIDIIVRGSGFLRYMMRFMVGALIQVGLGKISAEYIENLLNTTPERTICQYKAEPQGLYLFDISYHKVV